MNDNIFLDQAQSFPTLGSYKIVRTLGSGGMSNVFQGIHQQTGNVVALKVLPRRLAQNAVLLQRFLREAKSAEALDHPNIVAIYDRGSDNGRHYLVLEYVEGHDLAEHVREVGPLDDHKTIRIAREVSEGLRYALKRGMIHRDIKPANLLITNHGLTKIIDLGLALQQIDEDERVTRLGTTVGTVDYMSPEQARDSRRINETSDLYSLGCTLYFLLTGLPPFAGGTLADKLARHHSAPVPNVRTRIPEINHDLGDLVEQLMAKRPADRPSGYDELLGQLDRIARGIPRHQATKLPDVIVDEDDSDDAIELTIANPRQQESKPARSVASVSEPLLSEEICLAELAALDSNGQDPDKSQVHQKLPNQDISDLSAISVLFDEPNALPVLTGLQKNELPLRTWAVAGMFVGMFVALCGLGIGFLISNRHQSDTALRNIASEEGDDRIPIETRRPDSIETSGSSPARAKSDLESGSNPVNRPASLTDLTISGASTNTAYPVISQEDLVGLGFPLDVASSLSLEDHCTIVRRFKFPEESGTSSVANALTRPENTIEIADAGPVREDHFEMTGKEKTIRGKAGYRPILRIDSASSATNRDNVAKIMLSDEGTEQLTLENIDLIVDVRDLPKNQTSIFQCRGAALNLLHCSITIVNGLDRVGFSLIETINGSKSNRIRVRDTLVRGSVPVLINVASDQCDIDIRRSVLTNLGGTLIRFGTAERPDRILRSLDTVFCLDSSLFESQSRSNRLMWHNFRSTIINANAKKSLPWSLPRDQGSKDELSWLNYRGGNNQWFGWTSVPERSVTLDPLSSSLRLDGSTQLLALLSDQVESQPWPKVFLEKKTNPRDFGAILKSRQNDLMQVASPNPWIFEQTVDRFTRLVDSGAAIGGTSRPVPTSRETIKLNYDLSRGADDFNNGLKILQKSPLKQYEIRLSGTDLTTIDTVRVPQGINLKIVGNQLANPGMTNLQLAPHQTSEALFVVDEGNLELENLSILVDDAKATTKAVIVNGGSVSARNCSFKSRRNETKSPHSLIQIHDSVSTNWSQNSQTASIPQSINRPVIFMENCWLWADRPAISLEIARGYAHFRNCVMIADHSAIRIQTPKLMSSPSDLVADLYLETCTILSDRFALDATELGFPDLQPDRPFLIWSRNCVFPRAWREQGGLLALHPERFARGNIFWDSANDLFDVSQFLVDGTEDPASTKLTDFRRDWIEIWGINHARSDRGPDPRRTDRILNFREPQRNRNSKPTVSQVELDSEKHRNQGANFKLLPSVPRS